MKGSVSFVALVATVAIGVGCSSPLPAPTPDQERITLDEYRIRVETGTPAPRMAPVVTLPAGAILKLRIPPMKADLADSPLLTSIDGLQAGLRWDTPFEAVQDAELILRVREPFQIDLERFLISRDGKKWKQLGSYFVPALGAVTEFTVTDGERRKVALPAWAFAELLVVPPSKPEE